MSDKVAFAAQYLSDERLTALTNIYWRNYVDRGDLVKKVFIIAKEDGVVILSCFQRLASC